MTVLVVDGTAKIRLKGGNVVASDLEGSSLEQPIADLELLVIVGRRILATSAVLLALAANNVPVVLVDGRGGASAVLFDPVQVGSFEARRAQYLCIESESCRIGMAKRFVESKLRGLYNLVRYELKYHPEAAQRVDADYLKARILSAASSLRDTDTLDRLRQVEAEGSQAAWSIVAALLPDGYSFTGRRPRKGDPINSAVDFTYAVLYGIMAKALVAAGLDPYAGFMHAARPGRLSLVYDFSELYKPLAIHSVIQAARRRKIRTYRDSPRLTPRSIEVLVSQLYYRLHTESEKRYKRKSIWVHPVREAQSLQKALTRREPYKPYTYNP